MAEKISYNQKDIQRYLQQQMSKEEMHSFEKAMMDDPFLSDALEGYQISVEPLAVRHLSEIEASIKNEKEGTKVVPFDSKRNNWWRIAALFILVAGSAILAYTLLKTSEKNISIAAKQAAPAPAIADTIKSVEQEVLASKPEFFPSEQLASNQKKTGSPVIKQEQAASPEPGSVASADQSMSLLRSANPVDTVGLSMATAAAPSMAKDRSEEKRSLAMNESRSEKEMIMRRISPIEIRGKVVDDKGQPLPYANVIAESNKATSTDINGNFTIRSADSVVGVSVASTGYSSVTATLKRKNFNNKIVLNQDAGSLSEVVVTGPKKLSGRAAGLKTGERGKAPEPAVGWQKFNQYIDSALENAKSRGEISSVGDVVLEFKVDRKGNPFNIETTNSATKALAEKAVEIIKKGPKWKSSTKNAKAKVVVSF